MLVGIDRNEEYILSLCLQLVKSTVMTSHAHKWPWDSYQSSVSLEVTLSRH
jgi:hypothetical protein